MRSRNAYQEFCQLAGKDPQIDQLFANRTDDQELQRLLTQKLQQQRGNTDLEDHDQQLIRAVLYKKKIKLFQRPWTKNEDDILKEIVQQHLAENQSIDKWGQVADQLAIKSNTRLRQAKYCKERWYSKLDPSIEKGPWGRKLELELLKLIAIKGKNWTALANELARTENSIKNRFHKIIKKTQKVGQLNNQEIFQQYGININQSLNAQEQSIIAFKLQKLSNVGPQIQDKKPQVENPKRKHTESIIQKILSGVNQDPEINYEKINTHYNEVIAERGENIQLEDEQLSSSGISDVQFGLIGPDQKNIHLIPKEQLQVIMDLLKQQQNKASQNKEAAKQKVQEAPQESIIIQKSFKKPKSQDIEQKAKPDSVIKKTVPTIDPTPLSHQQAALQPPSAASQKKKVIQQNQQQQQPQPYAMLYPPGMPAAVPQQQMAQQVHQQQMMQQYMYLPQNQKDQQAQGQQVQQPQPQFIPMMYQAPNMQQQMMMPPIQQPVQAINPQQQMQQNMMQQQLFQQQQQNQPNSNQQAQQTPYVQMMYPSPQMFPQQFAQPIFMPQPAMPVPVQQKQGQQGQMIYPPQQMMMVNPFQFDPSQQFQQQQQQYPYMMPMVYVPYSPPVQVKSEPDEK